MATSTTRRINLRDSRYCARIKTASLNKKPRRGATITASALRHSFESNIAQQYHRLRSSTRASTAARLHSRPKSESPVGARPHRLRSFARDQLRHLATFVPGRSRLPRSKVNLRFRD